MKQKILLTAIFKDDLEAVEIERMLNSFMPYMSGLCVALTGLSGKFTKLIKLIKKYRGEYIITTPQTHPQIYSLLPKESQIEGGYIFSNFAEARMTCFELAEKMQEKGKYDWWSWADCDDILCAGEELQAIAKRGKELKLDAIFFPYWYAIRLRKDNSFDQTCVQIEHIRERLLRPGIWKWVSRLHEIALPKEDNFRSTNSVYDFNPKEGRTCVWAHISPKERFEKAMDRNVQILEIQAREEQSQGKNDPRTKFYLAKTYYDRKKKHDLTLCKILLEEYLELSGWAEERSNAWEYLGNIQSMQGDHRGAIEQFLMALKEAPYRHMPYLLLAREYGELGMMDESNAYLDIVMKMESPQARTTIGNPMEIKFIAASLKYNQAIKKLDIDQAIYWLKIRNELAGTEDDGMLKVLEDAKLMNQAAIWVFNYAKWLKDNGHSDKVQYLLQTLPVELSREAFAQHIANEVQEPKVWESGSITYFAGSNFAEFNPKDAFLKGLGGSETAVIRLSEEWVKKGYKVTIFANIADECEVNGVKYRYYTAMNWKDQFNILILWRNVPLLDFDLKAKKIFLDLHDVASNLDYTPERIKKIDLAFFKSRYHRNMVPNLPDEKVRVISNGI